MTSIFPKVLEGFSTHIKEPLNRNSYILMINSGVLSSAGFIFWLVCSRGADANATGLATTAVSSLVMISIIARFGIDSSIMTYVPLLEADNRERFVNSSFVFSGVNAILLGAIFAIFGGRIVAPELEGVFQGSFGVSTFIIASLLLTWGFQFDSLLISQRRSDLALIKNLILSISRVSLVLLFISRMDYEEVFLVWSGSIFVAMIPTMLFFVPSSNGRFVPDSPSFIGGVKSIWKANIANFLVSVVMNFPLAIGSLIALSKWGAVDAGRYYIFWMIGAVGMIAPVSFSSSTLVEAKGLDTKEILLNKRHLVFCVFSAICVSLIGLTALPLFGEMFLPGDWVAVIPFAASSIPGYFFYAQLSYFRHKEFLIALVSMGLGLVLSFLGGITLLPIVVEQTGIVFFCSVSLFAIVGRVVSEYLQRRDGRLANG